MVSAEHPAPKDAPPKRRRRVWLVCGCSVLLLIGIVVLGLFSAEVLRLAGKDADARRVARRFQNHFPGGGPPLPEVYGGGMSIHRRDSLTFTEQLWNPMRPTISGTVDNQHDIDRIRVDVKRICEEEGYNAEFVLILVTLEGKVIQVRVEGK